MTRRRIITLDVKDAVRALSSIPLLDKSPPAELAEIARWSHVLTYDAGEVIVPEGETGLGFYIILRGNVHIEQAGAVIGRLGDGDFFGEIALLSDQPRNASVIAEKETTVLGVLRSYFKPMMTRNPRLALRILDAERARRGAGV